MMPSATKRFFELAHASKASLIVTESEGHAGLLASRNGPFGFSASEGKRFFAPNRLAGGRRGGNLPNMQGVRRCKKNRLNAWIGNGLFEFGRQFEPWRLRNRGRVRAPCFATPPINRRRLLLP